MLLFTGSENSRSFTMYGFTSENNNEQVHEILESLTAHQQLRSYGFFLVCFVALSPKSTAMVMAGRSVHLTIPFPGQA